MGLVRSPEIVELIQKHKQQIERCLSFLRKLLLKGERMTLSVTVTSDVVWLNDNIVIEVRESHSS